MKGKLIVLEGPEGGGKTLQQNNIRDYLKDKGYDIFITREPGGADISEQVRNILLDPKNTAMSSRTELFLYEAARAQFTEEILKPQLNQGKIILTDRFYHSTIAYQGFGRGLDLEMVKSLNSYATGGIRPDITFILDVPVEIGLKRARDVTGEKGDRMENEKISFHKKLRKAYLSLPKILPEENINVIDATMPPEQVYSRIRKELDNIF